MIRVNRLEDGKEVSLLKREVAFYFAGVASWFSLSHILGMLFISVFFAAAYFSLNEFLLSKTILGVLFFGFFFAAPIWMIHIFFQHRAEKWDAEGWLSYKARKQALIWFLLPVYFGFSQTYAQNLNNTSTVLACVLFCLCVTFLIFKVNLFEDQSFSSRIVSVTAGIFNSYIAISLYPFFVEALTYEIALKKDDWGGWPIIGISPETSFVISLGGYIVPAMLIFAGTLAVFFFVYRETKIDLSPDMENLRADRERKIDEFFEKRDADLVASVAAKNKPADSDNPLTVRDSQAVKPRMTFKDLEGNAELKEKLLTAAKEWNLGKGGKDGIKNGIFLYGPPGTGKTAFAEALAGELGLKIVKANVGSIASRWINQTTEQLRVLIEEAVRQAPCVLFLDEAESILAKRSDIARADSEEVKVVGTFLNLVQEKLHNSGVLLVAATNYKDRVDEAAMREGRFDFRIEVAYPDAPARMGLVMGVLRKAGKSVDEGVLERLVKRWAGFNVKRIQEAALRGCRFAATKEVGMKDFMRGLRDVQGNKTGAGENALALKDLYFDDEIKQRLENLAATFVRSDELEMRGGSVPRGIVFYGPPGTGKTAMAQALAKEADMTFIATNGKAILTDEKALNDICRKASDLRPAIIFIDEADDILGDRGMVNAAMKAHTNDLLARIDGAGGPLPDVVWILATNSIDSMDEAVERRFATKIELPVPGLKAITAMIADWAKPIDNIAGVKEEWVGEVAQFLEGLSPSVIKGILDSAKNHAAIQSVLRNTEFGITVNMVRDARKEMRV